jgi:hypothetical protein
VIKRAKQVREIEATQKALRESIEATKELAEKAEDLLQKHKRSLESDLSDPRAE